MSNEIKKQEMVNPPTSADLEANYSTLNNLDAKSFTLNDLKTAIEFLGEKEYNPDRFAIIASEEVRQTEIAAELAAIHSVKAGAALLVAKEHTPHGGWQDYLGKIDVSQPTAHRCMVMAQRAADKNMLNSSIFRLGISKAQEVLSLPEPELQEIVENDDRLDEFSRMSVREVREAVRKTRRENEKLKEKLEKGKSQLSDQEDELAKLRKEKRAPSTLESILMTVLTDLTKAEKKDVPEDESIRADVSLVMAEVKAKADRLYNKFCQTGKVKHQVPENMDDLDQEFGG